METTQQLDRFPDFFLVKPHAAAVTSQAVAELQRTFIKKGERGMKKALDAILSGETPGGYCSCCGLSFAEIHQLHRAQPYRFLCLERVLTTRHIEQQFGKLISLQSFNVAYSFQL